MSYIQLSSLPIAIKSFQIIKYNYTKNHCNQPFHLYIHQISIILKQGEEPLNLMGISPPIVIQPHRAAWVNAFTTDSIDKQDPKVLYIIIIIARESAIVIRALHACMHDNGIINPDRKTFAMWKIARIAWPGNTKKRGNKKSGESITPIRYNVIHMYILYSRYVLFR